MAPGAWHGEPLHNILVRMAWHNSSYILALVFDSSCVVHDGNRTEWSPIQSIIMRVNHEYGYRPTSDDAKSHALQFPMTIVKDLMEQFWIQLKFWIGSATVQLHASVRIIIDPWYIDQSDLRKFWYLCLNCNLLPRFFLIWPGLSLKSKARYITLCTR